MKTPHPTLRAVYYVNWTDIAAALALTDCEMEQADTPLGQRFTWGDAGLTLADVAIVRDILTDALMEIGVLQATETPTSADAQLALRRFQTQIDAWAADRLTLSIQSETSVSWPSATSTQTIGPGGNINVQRPVWISTITYVIPGTSPSVEVTMGPMDPDQYAQLTIKGLVSALPQLFFYQTSIDTALGTVFLWPQPSQALAAGQAG